MNRSRHRVLLLKKEYCPLCDGVRNILRGLRREMGLSWTEVDITLNNKFYAKYKNAIPVLIINGEKELRYPITEEAVREALV